MNPIIFRETGFADAAYDMSNFVGFRFKPHVRFYWLKGDNDPIDKNLEG